MIKVYDMASGNLQQIENEEDYSEEVLYSGYQPVVKDLMELRLQVVENNYSDKKAGAVTDDLADIDCESFISSQK